MTARAINIKIYSPIFSLYSKGLETGETIELHLVMFDYKNSSSSSRKSFKVRNISLKEHPRHLIDIKTHKKENKTSTIF